MAKPEPMTIRRAQSGIIAAIKRSKVYPEVCKNLMIENVLSHMSALSNAVGCIELAAQRAAAHGISKENSHEVPGA